MRITVSGLTDTRVWSRKPSTATLPAPLRTASPSYSAEPTASKRSVLPGCVAVTLPLASTTRATTGGRAAAAATCGALASVAWSSWRQSSPQMRASKLVPRTPMVAVLTRNSTPPGLRLPTSPVTKRMPPLSRRIASDSAPWTCEKRSSAKVVEGRSVNLLPSSRLTTA